MGMRRRVLATAALALSLGGTLYAQPLPERFLHLVKAPGVAGHEEAVRDAVRAQLPPWVHPRVDEIGNLVVTLGSGKPHVALVAALDEHGYIVSRITGDGYLRLHRPTAAFSHRLGDQYFVGQPVVVGTASGRLVPGVTATPSTHLSALVALSDAAEVTRIKTVQDLWVDVGAPSPREVAKLGIRLLDPVSLRERAQPLAFGRVAGVDGRLRAGAQALIEIVRGLPADGVAKGTVTIAWVAESQFRARGLACLAREIQPDRAYLVGFGEPSSGSAGGSATPRRPAPPGWEEVAIESRSVPALFPEAPVEVVDTRDIAALAAELAAAAGLPASVALPAGRGVTEVARPTRPPLPASIQLLQPVIEAYGVSGHEGPVRDAVLRRLPAWAKPQVDEKGNVTVRFGSGGRELLFVAHLDEVGFEVAALRDDGSATLRTRGGMFLSLYEAHPVLVHTPGGAVPAILIPREGYAAATTSQPKLEELALSFGTKSAAETRALGVTEGSAVTVRKRLEVLAGPRTTCRAMDDRVGSTALLLALRQLDPKAVKNRVTFAWSVDEEVGLGGAGFLATHLHPEVAFAIDTFVSTDTPVDLQYLANAKLGEGPVLRGVDSATIVPAETITRVQQLARQAGIPLQLGVTQGGTDASAFSSRGTIDVGLSWPGRYSHSPVEVMDRRDLEGLAKLIARLAQRF